MNKPFDQVDPGPGPVRTESLPDPLPADPFPIFRQWWDEAHARRAQPNPNAMTLATIDPDGRIGARIVLCKAFHMEQGFLVFYTNYQGRKGLAIDAGSRAALLFHWDALDRQVRIEGPVTKSHPEESDAYFASRPLESRLGAWASDQSRPIESRAAMEHKLEETMRRFGIDPRNPQPSRDVHIPRPAHWGGYRVWSESVELWAAGPGRLHERGLWKRSLGAIPGGYRAGPWTSTRLQP